MKKLKDNKLILIIGIAVVILLIVCLIIVLSRKPMNSSANSYNFNNDVVEFDNTTVYTNDKLSSRHCLNNICIEDVTFYYNDEFGRVEYTITNISNEVKSGYLKMVFNNQNLKVIYKDLGPRKTVKSSSQYVGIEIDDKSDYILEKLSKEEIKKIIK